MELGGQVLALSFGEPGQQGFLVAEEFVDAALDESVALRGQRHVAEPAVGARPLAAAVMFLASPSAGHVTGQVIHVNGGAYLGR